MISVQSFFDRNFDSETLPRDAVPAAPIVAETDQSDVVNAKEQGHAEGYEQGFSAGRLEGEKAAEATIGDRHVAALENIGTSLNALLSDSAEHRAELAQQLFEFALQTCERVLPEALTTSAKQRSVLAIQRCVRRLAGTSELRIAVSETTLRTHQADIEAALDQQRGSTKVELVADPNLEDGDARVEWLNGSMEYSFARICQTILQAVRAAAADQDLRSKSHD